MPFVNRIRRLTACLVLACAAAALSGCDPAAGLYGQWELDTTKLQTDLAQQGPLMAKLVPLMSLAAPTLEFKPDGTCQAKIGGLGGGSSASGTWRAVSREGNKLIVALKMDDETTEREISITVVDDNHLEMPLPSQVAGLGSKSVPFVRAPSK